MVRLRPNHRYESCSGQIPRTWWNSPPSQWTTSPSDIRRKDQAAEIRSGMTTFPPVRESRPLLSIIRVCFPFGTKNPVFSRDDAAISHRNLCEFIELRLPAPLRFPFVRTLYSVGSQNEMWSSWPSAATSIRLSPNEFDANQAMAEPSCPGRLH